MPIPMKPRLTTRPFPRLELLEPRIVPAAATFLLDGSGGITFFEPGPNEGNLDTSLALAGDVNGDGRMDYLFGSLNAMNAQGGRTGSVFVVFGVEGGFPSSFQMSSLNGTNGFAIFGTEESQLGVSMNAAGDVNGDGYDDIILGSPFSNAGAPGDTGAAYVVFGKGAAFAASFDITTLDGTNGFRVAGVRNFDFLGFSVAGVGDLNGDGFDEVAMGADGVGTDPIDTSGSGAAYVLYGKASGHAASISASAITGSVGFELRGIDHQYPPSSNPADVIVSAAGDFNGDGYDDMMVSWPLQGGSGNIGDKARGDVVVIFGRAQGSQPHPSYIQPADVTGGLGIRIRGANSEDRFGHTLAPAGDVNGDGIDDILIGADALHGPLIPESGRDTFGGAYVIFGSNNGFDLAGQTAAAVNGTNGFQFIGSIKQEFLGQEIAAGDVNGDGFNDIVVGSFSANKAFVVLGHAGTFPASITGKSINGKNGFALVARPGDQISSALMVSDTDGDGRADIFVGTREYGETKGVYLVRGFDTTLDFSANRKSATYVDIDGDLVTITATKGLLSPSQFVFSEVNPVTGGAQLLSATFNGTFTGANLIFSAKPGPNGGNSFVNIGFLDATGVDLGTVTIGGDLGLLKAGTLGGDAKIPGVKSLTVQSIGLFGLTTQAPGASELGVSVEGALAKLTVKDDVRASIAARGTDGGLGAITIGGSFASILAPVSISAGAGIASITIGGDIRVGVGAQSISAQTAIGKINVKGSLVGVTPVADITIAAFGQAVAPTKGTNTAIGPMTIGGSVHYTKILAGVLVPNPDASITSIAVSGDWIASSVQAGTVAGSDGKIGTLDDALVAGMGQTAVRATLGSFTVKGQAIGTSLGSNDMFGVVAEQIGKAKVGGRTFAFTKSAAEAFYAASSGAGSGTENPLFDFTIREIGGVVSALALGGAKLTIAADGKSATFVDVDGDLVTVKRTAGTFIAANFTIATAASGGGQLRKLVLTAAPNNAATGLTITAKPGPSGGNGWVNVGTIEALGPVGAVSVAGDLSTFDGGAAVGKKPGTASLTVRSTGLFGTTTGGNGALTFTDGLGKLSVATDLAFSSVTMDGAARTLGAVTIGGNFRGSVLQGQDGIASVKIAKSVIGGTIGSSAGAIGAVTVGGDFVNAILTGFAQVATPAKGLDIAIKSIAIAGSFETSDIRAGSTTANADASIGALSVGRAFFRSNVFVGIRAGVDASIGTDDDIKAPGGRDEAGRYSSIASVLIKGQALGTASPANDHFGIVAETIGKATIGKAVFKLTKGQHSPNDIFAAAPTLPGKGLPFDFYIREFTPPI